MPKAVPRVSHLAPAQPCGNVVAAWPTGIVAAPWP
jgi:hypothetical protein